VRDGEAPSPARADACTQQKIPRDAGCRTISYGDALGAAEGDGATLSVTGFAVAAGEILAAGLVAAFGAVVVAGEPAGAGEVVADAAGVGIPINSLCNALSLELR